MKYLLFLLTIISISLCISEAQDDPWIPTKDECPRWYSPCNPTITEIASDAANDSTIIYGHLRNRHYCEAAKILVRRTNKQIQKIKSVYSNWTHVNLESVIQNQLPKGHLKDLLFRLLKLLPQFISDDIKELHESWGNRNNVEEYLDTVGVLSKKGIHAAPKIGIDLRNYKSTSRPMNFIGHFKNDTREFLDCICTGWRPEVENGTVLRNDFSEEIGWLKNTVTIEGVDSNILSGIICKNNDLHLRAIYKEIRNERGHSYLEDLTKKKPLQGIDPLLHRAVISMYKITENRLEYFAERLHASLHNSKSDNYRILNRIFITRREIDLGDIKNTFEQMYNKSLGSMIMEKISNRQDPDYKTALLWLIQEKGN